ncbi:MAG: heavy metal sensor histidine kinase [Phycisphaerae bacterium]|nr:heavy metal sensor histidine kinase [Phycisphaerae bacterium]
MPLSVRSRITLFAACITLTVCLLVCVALYVGLHVSLHREVDAFLQGEVQEFKAILAHDEEDGLGEIEQEIRAELGSRFGADLRFRLLDATGRLLITSDPEDRFPNPWQPVEATPSDDSRVWFETLGSPSGSSSIRVCSQWANLRRQGEVIVQAAYLLDRVEQSLAICRVVCLLAMLLAALLSVLGGRAVAGRSLRPVAAITRTARQIGARQLSKRLPRSGAKDELDDLANTLNDMLERVERSFRQIQQFTADAAHELRTPLTALKGSAELALGQPRTQEQLRVVIEQSLEYYRVLARVTDDLLLLARLDAGQEPLRFERFCFPSVVEDVVELYRPLASDRGIDIAVDPHEDVWIRADPGKIRRLISNLLDNAIKYMGGAGTVNVNIHRRNGVVSTSIIDTGPGIPADDLPHVFERFFRVDRARAAAQDADARSVGLGLAISRSIVHAHSGEITIESAAGRGTQVTFTLCSDDGYVSR